MLRIYRDKNNNAHYFNYRNIDIASWVNDRVLIQFNSGKIMEIKDFDDEYHAGAFLTWLMIYTGESKSFNSYGSILEDFKASKELI